MGPDLDLKEKSEVAMEVLPGKENGIASRYAEDKPMPCVSNYEDRNFHVEDLHNDQAMALDRSEDLEVNITECTNSGENGQIEARYEDGTESMSSFGDIETESGALLGDTEVESQLCVRDMPTSIFDGYHGASRMRRKKLTDHWRRFIRPLMWRCKWLELQIKELHSQTLEYDSKLAEHERRKQFDLETFMLESPHAKSLPFYGHTQRTKVMKRKIRKRFEETTDMASYVLQHNLFSYYEKKKSATDGVCMDDDCSYLGKIISANDDFGVENGLASLDSRDSIHEEILRKIEVVQSEVRKLKARVDKVVNENPTKFSSVNRLSLPVACAALANSDQDPASLPENGDRMPIISPHTLSQDMSACNMRDCMPESAVSSHGEVTPLPDMIERRGQPLVGVSCENAEEGILINNDAGKEETGNLKSLDIELTDNLQVPTEEQTFQASEPDLPVEVPATRVRFGGKSVPKFRSNVSNSKRKRGRTKSRAGGRRQRS